MNNVENKGKGKNIAIIVLSIILIIVLGFICYDKLLKKEPIVNKEKNCPKCQECNNNKQEDMCLYDLKSLNGKYYGEKEHPNNNAFIHKVELILNDNNEAVLHQSDGADADYSKGTFVCEYNRIIYTPLYYDYENTDNSRYESDIQYTFIANKDELNYFYASSFPIKLEKQS